MIVSFGDRATEDLYHNRPTTRARRFPRDIVDLAFVKLDMIEGASSTLDLRSPPGNRLEALKADRKCNRGRSHMCHLTVVLQRAGAVAHRGPGVLT